MKKTNKLLAYVLAFCLVISCGFVSASSATKKSDKTGKYFLYAVETEGVKVEYSGLKEYYDPESTFIELNKDGTGILSSDGEDEEFEWNDKEFSSDGEKLSYKIDGDLLSIEIEDMKLTFVKEDSDTYKDLQSDDSSASSKSESSKKESSKSESSKTETSKTESSKTESSKKSDSKADKKTDSKTLPDSDPSVHDEVTIEKTELFNENGVTVTANKLKYDDDEDYGKYVLSYTIKNDSDKTINVSTALFSINGIMYDYGYIYGTVDAGKKLNDSCNIYFSDLESFDIGTIANIDIKVKAYDDDSYDDIGESKTVSVKTSADGTFNQKYDDSGVVIYDANDVKIICKKVVEDKYYDAGVIKFYIENNSDKDISISSSYNKTYINDTAADLSFYPNVAAGCKMYYDAAIYTSAEDLDIKDYNDIKTLDMEISLSDMDTYDDIDAEEVTVEFGE